MTPYTTSRGRGFNKINFLGLRFERLVVLSQDKADKYGNSKWLCRCDCGNERVVYSNNLRNGKTKSCGCLHQEIVSTQSRTSKTEGHTYISEYRVWEGMIRRCENTQCDAFKNYGGRGIFISDKWRNSFSSFYSDMGEKPSKFHTIDRIDNNGPYSSDNCRWATTKEQSNNKRTNVVFQGKTLKQWSEELELSYSTIWERFHKYGTVTKGGNNASI